MQVMPLKYIDGYRKQYNSGHELPADAVLDHFIERNLFSAEQQLRPQKRYHNPQAVYGDAYSDAGVHNRVSLGF